jgi:hypothetical protein
MTVHELREELLRAVKHSDQVEIQLNSVTPRGSTDRHLLRRVQRVEVHPKRIVLVIEMSALDHLRTAP